MKYWVLFFGIVFFSSCQDANQNKTDPGEGSQSEAEGFARDRPAGSQNYNWTFLTNQLFHFKAKVTIGQQVSKEEYVGKWLNMEDDGTFETGTNQKTDYTGEWNYDHDTDILTFYPDPKIEKNSQWKVKYNDHVLVLVGTAKYGDNATQIQLVRRGEKPLPEK